MSPIRRPSPTPKGAITDKKQLREVVDSWSFWNEHEPSLAWPRPAPTAEEREQGRAMARRVYRDETERREDEHVGAIILAMRRRERERIEWLMERGQLVGEALDEALRRLKVRKMGSV